MSALGILPVLGLLAWGFWAFYRIVQKHPAPPPPPMSAAETADLERRMRAGEFGQAAMWARQDPLLRPGTPIHPTAPARSHSHARPSGSSFRPYNLQTSAPPRPQQPVVEQPPVPDHYRQRLTDRRSWVRTPDGGFQYDLPFQARNQWGEDNEGNRRYR